MTGKRFELNNIVKKGTVSFWDNKKQVILNASHTLDKLNYFEEKNKQLEKENEQLKSDKEHLMGCLIRFFGYDDEDIDYNLNRESNREYGKQYYSMKEETKKELEE